MNNHDWIFLKTLGEELNLTKAAKKLFISQPAMTDKIKKLEKEFGCQLIVRKPRGIEFTSEGEIMVQYARKALTDYYDMKDDLASLQKDDLRGFLRIGCSNVFAKYHLPKLISDFHILYPKVEINFKSGFSQTLYRDFLRGEAHLAIVRGDHLWSEAKYLLWQEPLCLFSATPVDMEKLPELPYIHYVTDPGLQTVYDDWWFCHYRKKPHVITDNDAMDTVMKMVQGHVGYTILSDSCGQDFPELYKYPLKMRNNEVIFRKTWLYHRNNYESISVLKAFVDFVLKRYPPIKF